MKAITIKYIDTNLALSLSNRRDESRPFSVNGVTYSWNAKSVCFSLSDGTTRDASAVYADLLGLRNAAIVNSVVKIDKSSGLLFLQSIGLPIKRETYNSVVSVFEDIKYLNILSTYFGYQIDYIANCNDGSFHATATTCLIEF